jgi:hypothetical protein
MEGMGGETAAFSTAFPPPEWASRVKADGVSTPGDLITVMDPLNTIFEAPHPYYMPDTFWSTRAVDSLLSSNTAHGGSAVTMKQRLADDLRQKVELRGPPDTAIGVDSWMPFRPYKPVVLDGGVVEETAFTGRRTTTNNIEAVLCGGITRHTEKVLVSGSSQFDPYPNNGWTSVDVSNPEQVPIATSAVEDVMANVDSSVVVVRSSKKFDKPLFVNYAPLRTGKMWQSLDPASSPPFEKRQYAPKYTDVLTGDTESVWDSEFAIDGRRRFRPTKLGTPGTYVYDPFPAYSYPAPRPPHNPESPGPPDGRFLSVHPITNRIALYVWDNVLPTENNQGRPRFVPSLVRYETDA